MKIQQFDINQGMYIDTYLPIPPWGVRIVLRNGMILDFDVIVENDQEVGVVLHCNEPLVIEPVVSNAMKIKSKGK